MAFLAVLLRATPLAYAGSSAPAMTPVPDDDTPMLVEEHSDLPRVPVTRAARTGPRSWRTVPPKAPGFALFQPVPAVGPVAMCSSLHTDSRCEALVASIRPRTHAELMVFLN
jgi:hypothetical protein